MTIKCLGIESTAHTFGAGVVEFKTNFKILSNQKHSYFPKNGIKPDLAAQHHLKYSEKITNTALEAAKTKIQDIDIIAFSIGPGLAPCLIEGLKYSKNLASKYKKPFIEVNHCIAHIEIAKEITKCKSDFVVVFVSGGNSQILSKINNNYKIFGETQDIAVGNAIDKFARFANLGFPGGPLIEKLAKGGKYIDLPYCTKGCDFSFTGVITAAEKKIKKNKIQNICFSLQQVLFCSICECAERILGHLSINNLLLCGGVARNKTLQKILKTMTQERCAKFFCVPDEFAGDNGAMIAIAGIKNYINKTNCFFNKDISKINIFPKLRID